MRESYNPICVAAILNHPAWQLVTLALSAGKRQDNIGQSALASIPFPKLSNGQQAEFADSYGDTLGRIERVLSDEPLTQVCDNILSDALRLVIPPIETRPVAVTSVTMSRCCLHSKPADRQQMAWLC